MKEKIIHEVDMSDFDVETNKMARNYLKRIFLVGSMLLSPFIIAESCGDNTYTTDDQIIIDTPVPDND